MTLGNESQVDEVLRILEQIRSEACQNDVRGSVAYVLGVMRDNCIAPETAGTTRKELADLVRCGLLSDMVGHLETARTILMLADANKQAGLLDTVEVLLRIYARAERFVMECLGAHYAIPVGVFHGVVAAPSSTDDVDAAFAPTEETNYSAPFEVDVGGKVGRPAMELSPEEQTKLARRAVEALQRHDQLTFGRAMDTAGQPWGLHVPIWERFPSYEEFLEKIARATVIELTDEDMEVLEQPLWGLLNPPPLPSQQKAAEDSLPLQA